MDNFMSYFTPHVCFDQLNTSYVLLYANNVVMLVKGCKGDL